MSGRNLGRKHTYADVVAKIVAMGDNPDALYRLDWCQFGDAIAKDINYASMIKESPEIRAAVKEHGGIAEIWRMNFPDSYNRMRYGHPAYNYRWQRQTVATTESSLSAWNV